MNTETRLQSLENALTTLIYKGDEVSARFTNLEQRMQLLEENQRLMLDFMRENFEQIHQAHAAILKRLEAK